MLATAAAALAAASKIESPQEALARSQPPRPSVITATVRRTVLSETVDSRGQVSAGQTVNVSGAATAPAGDDPVVTAMPLHVGEEVSSGRLLAEVSGRPLILLQGKLPSYRNLRPGDSGPDVVQLQQALSSLGYSITDNAGTFGSSTEEAVGTLYARLGYSAPTTAPSTATSTTATTSALTAEPTVTDSASPASGPTVTDSASSTARPTVTDSAPPTARPTVTNSAAPSHSPPPSDAKPVVYLPQGEVQYVPSLPARVASIKAGVGSAATGTMLALAEGGLQVTGSVDPVNGPLIKAGMRVTLSLQGTSGQSVAGTVTSVGALTVNSSTGASYPVTWSGVDSLPPSWAGQQVTVSITVRATSGPVLAVPSSAVYSSASGQTYVLLESGDREIDIPVRTGVSVGGMIQVSGALEPGRKVVVGVSGQ